jgi:hypothetical protein
MSRIHPKCPESDRFDRSVALDILLRQEPDEEGEEEEEEKEEDNGKEDNDTDDGYSDWACPYLFRE